MSLTEKLSRGTPEYTSGGNTDSCARVDHHSLWKAQDEPAHLNILIEDINTLFLCKKIEYRK